jgi:hypothetical protein
LHTLELIVSWDCRFGHLQGLVAQKRLATAGQELHFDLVRAAGRSSRDAEVDCLPGIDVLVV